MQGRETVTPSNTSLSEVGWEVRVGGVTVRERGEEGRGEGKRGERKGRGREGREKEGEKSRYIHNIT